MHTYSSNAYFNQRNEFLESTNDPYYSRSDSEFHDTRNGGL